MDVETLRSMLEAIQVGELSVDQAIERLRGFPYDDLGHTRLDTHRALRKGLPEVVFCQNKTPAQAVEIFEKLARHHKRVMGTRASAELAAAVQSQLPNTSYDPISRLITINNQEYTYDFIQSNIQPRTIETFTGISLDDFIIKTGINEPSKHDYILIGSDGYQKTINWDHLTNGLLTPEGEAIFSNLPKAFRVKNIVEIKVIQQ